MHLVEARAAVGAISLAVAQFFPDAEASGLPIIQVGIIKMAASLAGAVSIFGAV